MKTRIESFCLGEQASPPTSRLFVWSKENNFTTLRRNRIRNAKSAKYSGTAGHPTCCVNQKGGKALCFGHKSGSYFGSSLISAPDITICVPKPWRTEERFPAAMHFFLHGAFVQIRCKPNILLRKGTCREAGSLSLEKGSFPGKWLACLCKGPHSSQSLRSYTALWKAFRIYLYTPHFTSPSSANKVPHIRKLKKWPSFLGYLWCFLCNVSYASSWLLGRQRERDSKKSNAWC